MKKEDLKLGMTVYHKDVYYYKEPLTVIGIKENEIKVEGDFSGGTHKVIQQAWLPFEGISTIYDYKRKLECRETAKNVLLNIGDKVDVTTLKITLEILAHQILNITTDVELNHEIK